MLEAAELQVAEGAPSATVEGEHDRSAVELVGEANRVALRVRQLEVGRPVSDGKSLRERHRSEAHSQLLETLVDAGVDRLSWGHRDVSLWERRGVRGSRWLRGRPP